MGLRCTLTLTFMTIHHFLKLVHDSPIDSHADTIERPCSTFANTFGASSYVLGVKPFGSFVTAIIYSTILGGLSGVAPQARIAVVQIKKVATSINKINNMIDARNLRVITSIFQLLIISMSIFSQAKCITGIIVRELNAPLFIRFLHHDVFV